MGAPGEEQAAVAFELPVMGTEDATITSVEFNVDASGSEEGEPDRVIPLDAQKPGLVRACSATAPKQDTLVRTVSARREIENPATELDWMLAQIFVRDACLKNTTFYYVNSSQGQCWRFGSIWRRDGRALAFNMTGFSTSMRSFNVVIALLYMLLALFEYVSACPH